jgi:hypothetical protein
MKVFHPTIFTLLCLSSVAWVQGGLGVASACDLQPVYTPSVYTALVLEESGRIAQNANGCAGEHAEAIWGAGNHLAGYSCSDNANGQ